MLVNLENACLNIQIDTKGGELRSICDREGVEYLWQGDARYWKDRAPNIFPYIHSLSVSIWCLKNKNEYVSCVCVCVCVCVFQQT